MVVSVQAMNYLRHMWCHRYVITTNTVVLLRLLLPTTTFGFSFNWPRFSELPLVKLHLLKVNLWNFLSRFCRLDSRHFAVVPFPLLLLLLRTKGQPFQLNKRLCCYSIAAYHGQHVEERTVKNCQRLELGITSKWKYPYFGNTWITFKVV